MQVSADDALIDLVERLREEGYAFTTVSPTSHARIDARSPDVRARSLRDVFGWSRPFDEDVLSDACLTLMRRAGILAEGEDGLRSTIRVSSLDGKLFVHSAYPPSQSGAVFFGPDTHRFVSAVVAHLDGRTAPVRRAVDVGCGSGAAGIAVAARAPDAEVVLVDVNDAALRLAALNARLAGATVRPVRSNLLDAVEGSFDLVVSNPPFMLDRAGRTYRHGGGTLGEGLSLAVLEAAGRRLAPGGSLVLFTGACIVEGDDPFRTAAAALCRRAGLDGSYREIDPDAYGEELDDPGYAGVERIALVVLTATRGAAA